MLLTGALLAIHPHPIRPHPTHTPGHHALVCISMPSLTPSLPLMGHGRPLCPCRLATLSPPLPMQDLALVHQTLDHGLPRARPSKASKTVEAEQEEEEEEPPVKAKVGGWVGLFSGRVCVGDGVLGRGLGA